jgi:FixJ family two-component response regulator
VSERQIRARVAVIEDDDLERGALGRVLQAGGFEPDLFESAEAFIASGRDHQWLCLVVDVNLTGMSGIDLQRKLRAEGSEIPIIIISGNRTEAIRTSAERAGCIGFLWKPFSADSLLALVKSIADPPLT